MVEVAVLVHSTPDDHYVPGPRRHAAEDHLTDHLHVATPTRMYQEEAAVEEGGGEEMIVVVVPSAVLIPNLGLGRLHGKIEELAR